MQNLEYGIRDSPMFLKSMRFVSGMEGLVSDVKEDRGGYTKYGISSGAYPDLDIQSMTRDDALDIYYRDYWLKNKCSNLPEQLAISVFDSSVNCGVGRTAHWLQEACKAQGQDIKSDGIIGVLTLGAVLECDAWKLHSIITAKRLQHYSDICALHPSQMQFLRGWVNRVSSLGLYVSTS